MVAGVELPGARPTASRRIFSSLVAKIGAPHARFSINGGYELILLFGALFVLELLIPGILAVGYLDPHPFWVPVLLLSVQYGTLTGLATAVIAILARFFVGWPMPDGSEDYYAYFLRIWHDPALWLATAIVLGSISDRVIRERDRLAAGLNEADGQRRAIGRLCEDLGDHAQRLECQIAASEDRSADAALVALNEVRVCASSGLAAALERAIEIVLGSSVLRAAVYVCIDRGVVRADLAAANGPAVADDAPALDAVSPAAVEAVVGRRRTLVARHGDGAKVLAGIGVAACPIIEESGGVAGMFVIEEAIGPLTGPQLVGMTVLCRELAGHIQSLARSVSSPILALPDPVLTVAYRAAAAPSPSGVGVPSS